jgi:uncharacterized protein (UPF0179 family)
MHVRTIKSEQVFKVAISDPEDTRVKKFRAALVELASKCGGHVTGFEVKGKEIRLTFASKKVAEGVIGALKKRKIDVGEVSLFDEFFEDIAAAPVE